MSRYIRSHTVSVRQFDELVSEIYTPDPQDNQYVIDKYTYEAQQVVLHDLMQESWIKASPEHLILNEPFYLFIVGSGLLPERIHVPLSSQYLHALVLVNVDWRDAHTMLYDKAGIWSFSELHWLDDSLDRVEDVSEDSLIVRDVSVNLKRLGLYGNAVARHELYQLLNQLEVLTIDTMDSIVEHIDFEIPSQIRILDVDEYYSGSIYSDTFNLPNIEWLTLRDESYDRDEDINSDKMPRLNTLKVYNSTHLLETGPMSSLIELDIELVDIPDDNRLPPFSELYPNLEVLKIKFNPEDSLFRYQVSIEDMSIPINHLRTLHLFGEVDIDYLNDFSMLNQVTELKINSEDLDSLDDIYNLPLLHTLIPYGVEDDVSSIDRTMFKNQVDIQIPYSLRDRQPGFDMRSM